MTGKAAHTARFEPARVVHERRVRLRARVDQQGEVRINVRCYGARDRLPESLGHSAGLQPLDRRATRSSFARRAGLAAGEPRARTDLRQHLTTSACRAQLERKQLRAWVN